MKKYICPKCGNAPVAMNELFRDSSINYIIDPDGKIDGNQIVQMSPGDPYCVTAYCLCGHSWRLRSVSQITEVRGYVDNEE